MSGGQRIAGEVGAIIDLGGLLRRKEVILKFQDLRRAAGQVSRRRIDRNALEIIASAVDQKAALVELEVAAPGEAVDTVEHRQAIREWSRLLNRKEPGAVNRHEGRNRRRLHVALHGIGTARGGSHAAGKLLGQRGRWDEIDKTGVD